MMFLFVHGCGASQSLWLLHIRNVLHISNEMSDRDILDTFTIPFPGHPRDDKSFRYKEFRSWVNDFQKKNSSKQAELAKKFILSHPPEVIKVLKDPRLTLVGHGGGAALCMEYSLENSTSVNKLIILNFTVKFSFLPFLFYKFTVWSLNKMSFKVLRFTKNLISNTRVKTFLTIFLENPRRKGFFSYFKYLENFDFEELFQKATLNNQLNFLRIPLLCIIGTNDRLVSRKSKKSLEKLHDHKKPLIKRKKTVLPSSHKGELLPAKIIQIRGGHSLIDSDSPEIINAIRNHLKI